MKQAESNDWRPLQIIYLLDKGENIRVKKNIING
jgi:hypothetical protein